MKRRLLVCGITLAAAIGAIFVNGCGGSSTARDEGYYTEEAAVSSGAYDYGYDYSYDTAMASDGYGSTQADSLNESSANQRKRIITANVTAETRTFDDTLAAVEAKVAELGGYIESIDTYNGNSATTYSGKKTSSMKIRIPAEKLELFLDTVKSSCNVTNYSKSEDDITLTYVDLESHITSLRTEQDRLNELLEQGETIEDLITIEERLAEVRYELESYQSQLRTFDNKIDYSTVYFDLSEVKELTPVEEPTVWQEITEGFTSNLTGVGEALVDFFIWLIVSSPVFAVFGVIGLVVFLIVRANIKRKRRMILALKQKAQAEAAQNETTEDKAQ